MANIEQRRRSYYPLHILWIVIAAQTVESAFNWSATNVWPQHRLPGDGHEVFIQYSKCTVCLKDSRVAALFSRSPDRLTVLDSSDHRYRENWSVTVLRLPLYWYTKEAIFHYKIWARNFFLLPLFSTLDAITRICKRLLHYRVNARLSIKMIPKRDVDPL